MDAARAYVAAALQLPPPLPAAAPLRVSVLLRPDTRRFLNPDPIRAGLEADGHLVRMVTEIGTAAHTFRAQLLAVCGSDIVVSAHGAQARNARAGCPVSQADSCVLPPRAARLRAVLQAGPGVG